ncbi:yb1688 [Wigglesworthia glossinidia endosymbiont of Glossina brevipalpis]|uniref:Yb1688 protein n=1 Tax=Wigglesworthia glossinidia brevipalpis TaxID=36870 RepID=Q8D3H5_WIGBR|nr:yb1688 [Wigglesworthia glossinidia endosymbiont of Glossina brevipalpis]
MNFNTIFSSSFKIITNLIFIFFVLYGCFLILNPFIISFIWASIIVISTWPLFIRIKKFLYNSYFLSILLMEMLLICFFIFPVFIVSTSFFKNFSKMISLIITFDQYIFSNLLLIKKIPIIGNKLFNTINILIYEKNLSLYEKLEPYITHITKIILSNLTLIWNLFFNCLLTVLFSIFLYFKGNYINKFIKIFIYYIDDIKGKELVVLAEKSIRSVFVSVILASIIQTILSSIGLFISNVPFKSILIILIFIFCITQLGIFPIFIPIILWFYYKENYIFSTILFVWSCLVFALDNILKQILIKSIGIKLHNLLIIFGILGGFLSFGMIGIFIGPTILTISWNLLRNLTFNYKIKKIN